MQNKISIENGIFAKNFKVLMDVLKISNSDISKVFGVTVQTISNLRKGKTNPTYKQLKILGSVYNINLNWILFDDGEMHRGEASPDIVQAALDHRKEIDSGSKYLVEASEMVELLKIKQEKSQRDIEKLTSNVKSLLEFLQAKGIDLPKG